MTEESPTTPFELQCQMAMELGHAAAYRKFAASLPDTPEGKKIKAAIENKVLTPVHKYMLAAFAPKA